jgi:hypothetical protein
MKQLPMILALFRNCSWRYGFHRACVSSLILISLSVMALGSLPGKDRVSPQDRCISMFKAAAAPAPMPKDSPKPLFFLDQSPMFDLGTQLTLIDPSSKWSLLSPAKEDGHEPGFYSRIERPPRSFA